ncbi:MAG: NUDIX hydrolase [bacterium]|nr:NUDIX hydrolase [bacterium]
MNPWKTLSSREVYRNPWIRLREDQVIRPDGQPGIYGVIEAKKASGVLVVDNDGLIVLVGQYRYTMECYSWELIAGGTEPDETPLVAAQRELREEAGLIAHDWRPLGHELHLSNCFSSERAYLFLARDLTATESSPEGTEVLQIRRVSFAEAQAMVLSGAIQDAMTVIGLLLYGCSQELDELQRHP